MIFKNITLLILALFIGTFLSACDFFQERTPYERASNNNWRLFWVWLSKDARKAYSHSILYTNRIRSDCQPNCPKVDIWQYAYKHPQTGEVIRSGNPISNLKEFWKVPFEARVVAVTLYGDNPP